MNYISLYIIKKKRHTIIYMNNHIIKNKQLKLYKLNDIYNYTFLDNFKEYYDIIYIYNLLEYVNLKNMINYIHLKWLKMKNIITINNNIEKIYICDSKKFDEILNKFIDNEYSISILTVNLILRYNS
jgi:hypothetical protein|tara:strand:+ start:305 stop:685 length:381 start_codon:yes stop_codon:yes gene_type:complete